MIFWRETVMPNLEPIIRTDEIFDQLIKNANEYTKKM